MLAEAPNGTPDVILIATGSEVQIAVEARELLKGEGINARVVSAPCLEWFEEQDAEYRESVLPAAVKARVSIEAGLGLDLARRTSATPAAASRSSTSAPPPTTRPCSASSASPPRPPSPPPRSRSARRRAPRAARSPPKEEEEHDRDTPTADLSAAGVSIWLDDLSRERIKSGGLQKLIAEKNVVGVTTNPTIFAAALAKGECYDEQVAELAAAGTNVTDAVFEITTDDVAAACDVFRPIYDATDGYDGRVSIEVEPGLAHDAAGHHRAGQGSSGPRSTARTR